MLPTNEPTYRIYIYLYPAFSEPSSMQTWKQVAYYLHFTHKHKAVVVDGECSLNLLVFRSCYFGCNKISIFSYCVLRTYGVWCVPKSHFSWMASGFSFENLLLFSWNKRSNFLSFSVAIEARVAVVEWIRAIMNGYESRILHISKMEFPIWRQPPKNII